MPYPDAHVESSLPRLGTALSALAASVALTDFLRRSVQIRDLRCALGLPRLASASVRQRWLGAPHVFLKLGSSARFDETCCEVALPVEQAAQLIDRVLGGTGRVAVPSKAGIPSAAECGVLAYFAARCIRELDSALRLQDVAEEPALSADPDALLWPLRISAADDLKLDLKLIFSPREPCLTERIGVRLALPDVLDASQLGEIQAGDLLASDTWSLYGTCDGLSGLLELRALGCDERAWVALQAGAIRLAQVVPVAQRGSRAELLLAELTLEIRELAQLLTHASVPCAMLSSPKLLVDDQPIARGELVRFQGGMALKVY